MLTSKLLKPHKLKTSILSDPKSCFTYAHKGWKVNRWSKAELGINYANSHFATSNCHCNISFSLIFCLSHSLFYLVYSALEIPLNSQANTDVQPNSWKLQTTAIFSCTLLEKGRVGGFFPKSSNYFISTT